MNIRLLDIFLTEDEVYEKVETEIQKEAYRILSDRYYDLQYAPIKNKTDIYSYMQFFDIDPSNIKNIHDKFTEYNKEDGCLYYNITDILEWGREFRDPTEIQGAVSYGDFINGFLPNSKFLNSAYNTEIKFIKKINNLSAVEYVNLIFLIKKYYPDLISEDLNIYNIGNKLKEKLVKSDNKLLSIKKLWNILEFNCTGICDYSDDILEKIKTVNKNNVKQVNKNIKDMLLDDIYESEYPWLEDMSYSGELENTILFLKILPEDIDFNKISYLPSYDKALFGKEVDNSKVQGNYLKAFVKKLPEKLYKELIVYKYKNNNTIYLKDEPHLEIQSF